MIFFQPFHVRLSCKDDLCPLSIHLFQTSPTTNLSTIVVAQMFGKLPEMGVLSMKLVCCKPVHDAVHDPLNQCDSPTRLGRRRDDGDVHCPGRSAIRGSAKDERSGNSCWRKLRVLTPDASDKAAQRGSREKGRSTAAYDSVFFFFLTFWPGKAPVFDRLFFLITALTSVELVTPVCQSHCHLPVFESVHCLDATSHSRHPPTTEMCPSNPVCCTTNQCEGSVNGTHSFRLFIPPNLVRPGGCKQHPLKTTEIIGSTVGTCRSYTTTECEIVGKIMLRTTNFSQLEHVPKYRGRKCLLHDGSVSKNRVRHTLFPSVHSSELGPTRGMQAAPVENDRNIWINSGHMSVLHNQAYVKWFK